MSGSEKINLSEIANISEDEFKKQLLAWIDDRGVSRTLQSKLRAELFEHFNRTQLGRQIAVQHQKSHRIELSPLVLVLNTLVAEFLYVENCHFSLSVFSAEVPYKNTLPDFEAATTTNQKPFRLSERELKDIFQAIGMSESNAETIRKFYTCNYSGDGDSTTDTLRKSLLYSIFKIVFTGAEVNATKATPKNGTKEMKNESILSVDTNSSTKCANCSMDLKKIKKCQINSRYFKYLHRYLDILSQRVRDMSKSLIEIHSDSPSKRKSIAETSAALESNLKKTLDKIIEKVNHLSKSKRKSRKLQDFLQSIDRLSSNLETCANNMERLLVTVTNKCSDPKRPSTTFAMKENSIDVDYCTWLQELKTSENGRRFVNRLEASLQKTLAQEQESCEKIYEEKMKNYRMLIKLHYKEKYAKNVKCSNVNSPLTAKSAEIKSPKKKINASMKCNELLSNALKHAANEKEEYVDRIVQTAKVRLKQLENESEKLDKSFQNYLKQQTTQKMQLDEDITNIWHDYTFGKILLENRDLTTSRKTLLPHQTSITNSTLLNSVRSAEIDTHTVASFDTKKTFKNPFKQFSTEKTFAKRRPKSEISKNQNIAALESNDSNNQRDKVHIELALQTVSSESSYGQLPSPKRNGFNGNNKILLRQGKPITSVVNQMAVSEGESENHINVKESKITSSGNTENEQNINNEQLPLAIASTDVIEPRKIVLEMEPAPAANNLPLKPPEFICAEQDSVTDDELNESLEISIGPKRDASTSEDI